MTGELDSIVEESPSAVTKLDRQWRIVYLNREARRMLEPSGDVIGRDHWECFPYSTDPSLPWWSHYHRAMDQGIAGEFEHFYPEPLNSCLRVTVRPLSDGIAIYFNDITAEQNARTALAGEKNRLRVAVETAQMGLWELELATRTLLCSAICKKHFGRASHEPMNFEDIRQSIHPDDWGAMEEALRSAVQENTLYRREYRVIWPDGSRHWVLASGRTRYSHEMEPVSVEGVTLDVTERHQAVDALIQTEKLAAVGRLAASIAHEINNPLEAVTNLLFLARTTEESAARDEFLAAAEAELRRVGVIANQTLRFHKQSTRPTSVTCEQLFESVLSIHQGRMASCDVRLEKRKRARLPVFCFDGEIRQILSNLLGNALDAMGSRGGRILLRSRDGHDWKSGRPGLVMTVADNGCGIPPDVLSRIFEAFFTTKEVRGTGLGLWVSQEIVARHKGRLLVRSSTRKGHSGTVFSLFLPADAQL